MYRICHAVFSTNRVEYLRRTLAAQRYFDFADCEVERILFDDMPHGRDDEQIREIGSFFGYREIVLHQENISIGATWEEFWSLIRERDYDFVLHQEDDVVLLEPVCLAEMIEVLQIRPDLSQVVLKRQPWYGHEKPSEALGDDFIHKNFRGEFSAAQVYFTPITSLYSMDRVRFDYHAWYRKNYPDEPIFHTANINEALIGKALLEHSQLRSMHLKGSRGQNLIDHIGDYTIGKKLLPHEPGYQAFAIFDPKLKYWSGSGRLYEPGQGQAAE
jgi:hypothetical protein